MVHNQLEDEVKNNKNNFLDGIGAFPGILGATGLSYVLKLSKCINLGDVYSEGLNLDVNLAIGSGLYSGRVSNRNKKIAGLFTFGLSCVPELTMLFDSGDIDKVSFLGGAKLLYYGIGYAFGSIFRK